jgi:predicted kinase
MMHAGRYTPATEELVRDVEVFVVTQALRLGRDVVVDDTNLDPETVKLWLSCAMAGVAAVEFLPIDTPLEECIRRDAQRAMPVGEEVIRRMAAKAGLA